MLAERVIEWTEEWKQQGLEQGRQESCQEGEATLLLHLLRLRFGPLPTEVEARVTAVNTETLLQYSERILTASSLKAVFAA